MYSSKESRSSKASNEESARTAYSTGRSLPAVKPNMLSDGTVQKQPLEEDMPAQGKFETLQREEDEEIMQGKFEPVQRTEEEEPMQGKFETLQREEDEETMQGKFETVQRIEEDEPMQGKFDTVQREKNNNSNANHSNNNSNNTGLPNKLKNGVEQLSGVSLNDVKVHYNSPKPATIQAHAYAQGKDIHVAPGQEKHLPHEAWHTAQQKQGRVKPTIQMKQGIPVNDDTGLESEADTMGAKAMEVGKDH